MGRRKSPLLSAFFKMTRAGMRQSARIGKAAAQQGIASGNQLAKDAGRMLHAVATPTDAPQAVTGGRWYEGRWGLGPLAMRRYRLFVPTGGSARQPLPLLLLLHGCAQDTAAFAAVTRAAAVARSRGFAVLLPEQAHGIDIALERYLSAGGVMSVNLFHRRIRDLIRNVTALEDVPWAGEPRWVSRPRNLGRATVEGVEFDAKFRLTELQPDWLPLDLRMNLSLYRSRVESVPGPDNRIDQQPHAVGNLGADYRFRGTPWTVGGSLGLTPGYRTQLTEFQSQELGLRRVLDAYVLWQIDAGTRLRLSLANLVPIDSVGTVSVLQGSQLQTVNTVGRTDLNATLRLEMKL